MWASFLIAAVAALVLATNVQSAAFINFHRLEPRYVQGLKAPTGYNYSWAVDNNRLALDTTGLKSYLTRTTINRTATTTQQTFVDSCTQFCEKTNGCAMAHLIMFANFTEGNVICAVYNAASPKSSAFYTKGINGGNGTCRLQQQQQQQQEYDQQHDEHDQQYHEQHHEHERHHKQHHEQHHIEIKLIVGVGVHQQRSTKLD